MTRTIFFKHPNIPPVLDNHMVEKLEKQHFYKGVLMYQLADKSTPISLVLGDAIFGLAVLFFCYIFIFIFLV